jgi:hypothetical protein
MLNYEWNLALYSSVVGLLHLVFNIPVHISSI